MKILLADGVEFVARLVEFLALLPANVLVHDLLHPSQIGLHLSRWQRHYKQTELDTEGNNLYIYTQYIRFGYNK